jgi:carboxypeptidase Taq
MTASSTDSDEAFELLHDRAKRLAYLEDASLLLNWDQQVAMPDGGGPARSEQFAAISAAKHDLLTSEETAALLEDLDPTDLSEKRAAIVREVRQEHERERAVPKSLTEALSRVQSDAYEHWQAAKRNDDFSRFATALESHVDRQRERARHIDDQRRPYSVLFADGAPYLSVDRVENLFDDLLDALVPLIDDIRASDAELATDVLGGEFDTDRQMDLTEAVLDRLGYDWSRGRLDTAPHPFDGLTQYDARITTRFDRSNLASGLTSAIHEFGHATYNLGLPDDEYGSPLARARSHGVHESQSRFWENHIARSRAFWERVLPTAREYFPQLETVTPREAYEAVNQVHDDNLVRVEADELTYHLHIIVRHEIENELLDGELSVSEVPRRWNDKYEEYLDVRPRTDENGCLQDVHWTTAFGMFPNYTVGSVLAAQIAAAMEDELGPLESVIRDGDFDVVHEWLTENIHRHGRRFRTDELIRRATGEDPTADYFIEYVTEKYTELYGL